LGPEKAASSTAANIANPVFSPNKSYLLSGNDYSRSACRATIGETGLVNKTLFGFGTFSGFIVAIKPRMYYL
jgi:hypothetical protein